MSKIICYDALCGSGKTTKVKDYVIENPNEKYIYISPFLEESYKFSGILMFELFNTDLAAWIGFLSTVLLSFQYMLDKYLVE